jgi:hypothetical protein
MKKVYTDIIEIAMDTQGVFGGLGSRYVRDILSDMQYLDYENDKKNLRHDATSLLSDFESSIYKAKIKLNSKRWQKSNS